MIDRIHIGDDEALAAGRRIMAINAAALFNPSAEHCIARYVDGSFVGGIVYSNATQASIEMSVAGVAARWLSRDLLWMAFDFPFNQLNLKKVFARIHTCNIASLQFNANLGFKDEALLKDVFPDGDMVIRSLYKADCRFLNIVPRHYRRGDACDEHETERTQSA